MPKKQKPKTYPELREVWYKKLKDSGFEDIEADKHNTAGGMGWSNKFKTAETARNWESKREYYSMAGRFLHEYKFKNERERIIWEYWANGLSVRNIAKTLTKVSLVMTRDKVWRTLKPLIEKMKSMYLVGHND